MINRYVGRTSWAQWKQFPWLGMARVTDAYLADAPFFQFTDPSHVDIWHPQKGNRDLPVESVPTQFNASGWNGSASYLGGCQFRQDTFAAAIAGSDKPFSMAWEIQPLTCPLNSYLFWANEGTSSSKRHGLIFTGTNGNMRVVRSDGTTTKQGAVAAMTLGGLYIYIQTFTGTSVSTRLNGVQIDTNADLDVGSLAMSHWALSEAFTTGPSSVPVVAVRTFLYGDGTVWPATDIAIIESALRGSAGV